MSHTCVQPQKKMSACEASEILELGQTREYTAIATALLEKVLTDNRLPGKSAQLWQILFSKARFDQDLKVRAAVPYLAEAIGKSLRQTQRYIDVLCDLGYLLIETNYRPNGGQLTNTYYVRVPKDLLAIAKTSHPRRNVKPAAQQADYSAWACMHPNARPHEDSNVTRGTFEPEQSPEVVLVGEKPEALHDACFSSIHDRGEGDISVTPNNNIHTHLSNKVNHKNNNTKGKRENLENAEQSAVSIPQMSHPTMLVVEKLSILEEREEGAKESLENPELVLLATQLTAAEKELAAIISESHAIRCNPHASYDEIRRIDSIHSTLECVYIPRLKAKIASLEAEVQKTRQLKTEGWAAQLPGERAISEQEFKWLKKQLTVCDLKGKDPNQLLNEITFEVRFGSLKTRKADQKPMEIRHGLNVALKLVREGRWTTPASLESTMAAG